MLEPINGSSLLATVDEQEYESLRRHYQSVWAPVNVYIADKVDDLVAIRWELNRLRQVRRQHLARVFNDVTAIHRDAAAETSVVTETEIQAGTPATPLERLDLRIRRCQIEISRVERDILRVSHYFSANGASQNLLKTNDEVSRQNPTEPAPRHAAAPVRPAPAACATAPVSFRGGVPPVAPPAPGLSPLPSRVCPPGQP
ncbi:MAG: hypothetical protein JNM66_30290 [Bryobacterales bacterium]|nr:hypothetical protein [Bryobacterales bacterium]